MNQCSNVNWTGFCVFFNLCFWKLIRGHLCDVLLRILSIYCIQFAVVYWTCSRRDANASSGLARCAVVTLLLFVFCITNLVAYRQWLFPALHTQLFETSPQLISWLWFPSPHAPFPHAFGDRILILESSYRVPVETQSFLVPSSSFIHAPPVNKE